MVTRPARPRRAALCSASPCRRWIQARPERLHALQPRVWMSPLRCRSPRFRPLVSIIYFHLPGSAQRPVGNSLEMGGADASYIVFVDFDTEAGTSRNPGRAVVDHDRRLQDFYLHDKGGGVEFRAKRNVRGR